MQQPEISASQEWRRGWALVLAATVGFSFHSMMSNSTGVFMGPLGSEFGWNRTQLSSGVSIAAGISAVLSPFFGILIDRWGTRRLALPGIVATGLVIACFSLMTGAIFQWLALWCIYAVISMTVKSTVWTTSVAGAFSAARGLALGITLCGVALAQAVAPPLVNWAIETVGWRGAFAYVGLGWAALALLFCIPFLRDFHLDQARAEGKAYTRDHLTGLSVAQAWRDGALWRLGISTLIIMILTLGLQVHQFEILVDAGVTRANAAWLGSLFGIAGIAGKIVTGVLIDRYSPNWVGGLTLGSCAISFLLLLDSIRTPAFIVAAIIIAGYAAGTKLQICGYLTTRFAGMRNFGKIFGMMAALMAAGTSIGPILAGQVYDNTGSYYYFLIMGVVGSIVSGLLIMSMPRYPVFQQPEAKPAVA